MPRPMRDLLSGVAGRTSLHMPAAQGRAPFHAFSPYRWDTTELPVTDDLYHPTGEIALAEGYAALSAGAQTTLLLHGGSTAGIHTMLLYAIGPGGQVVLPRNAHISCLNLCATANVEPVFAHPSFTPEGRLYTTPQAYARALDAHPSAKAVLALHSDYYGLVCDLPAIARETHTRGKLLLCDEAHGAYFNWRVDIPNAGACGADLFVQSAHKTLPALTPGAWLHAMPGMDATRLRELLRMVQTSSPSFLIMQSLDDARAWMDQNGAQACQKLATAVERFYTQAGKFGFSDGQTHPPEGTTYDRLRLVLYAPQGGDRLQAQLQALGLDVEMCDVDHVVCILSLLDQAKRLRQLLRALESIARQNAYANTSANADVPLPRETTSHFGHSPLAILPVQWPSRRISITSAAFAKREQVSLTQSIGRISAGFVGRYPPGVAWLTPGDEITSEIAALIAATPHAYLFGLNAQLELQCVHP